MDRHLSEEELLAVLAATADGSDREAARRHLRTCAACRAALEEARANERLFGELVDLAGAAGSSDGEPAALLTRDAIPGHELLGEIHCGGQGTVYLALQRATQRRVALKVIQRGACATDRERRRFAREVELASRLRHPGIVCIFESGETAGRLWYSMELAEAEPLDRYLAERELAREERLALVEHIAEAVAYAHRRGVIHRDLKPANILVDAEGAPRLVDFGLALPSGHAPSERLTMEGSFLGTLAYASPEQARGEDVDTRTDVHALGLILFEVLTGHLPWDTRGSVTAALRRIERGAPVESLGSAGGLDRELRTILATALARDADERYASADAFLRDLRHYRAREPLEARPHRMGYVLRKALARHRLGVALTSGVLLVTGISGWLVLREGSRAAAERERAQLVRDVMSAIVEAGGPMQAGPYPVGAGDRHAVLEESLARLEAQPDATPDVHGALLLSLGESFASRLRNLEAETHLRRALERFEEAGDESGRTRALEALAGVLAQGGSAEAIARAEEALARRRAESPPDELRLAQGERLLARAFLGRLPEEPEDDERARELLARSEARLVQLLDEEHPEVAFTLTLRARFAETREEALALYRRALAVLERHPGEAPRTIRCLDGLAGTLLALDRFDEADELLQRSTRLTRQTYGDEHTVDHLRRRARLERLAGHPTAAERLNRRALLTELEAWRARELGSAASREAVRELESIAPSLGGKSGEGGEGPVPYARAFRCLRALRGDGDFELSSWMNEWAILLASQGQHGTAERLLEESLHIHCRAYGLDCPNRQQTLLLLAERLVERGEGEAARARLEELLERAVRRGTEGERHARRARELLARVAPTRSTVEDTP